MADPAARPPGRRGFWAAAVVLGLTALAVVLLAVSGAREARESRITALGADSVVRVGDRPVAVYVDGSAVDGSVDGVSCRVDGGDGDAVPLRERDAALSVGRWDRVGATPSSLSPGTFRVACDGAGDARLGSGLDPSVAGLAARFVGAVAIGALGVAVTIVIVAVTVWRRVRARRA